MMREGGKRYRRETHWLQPRSEKWADATASDAAPEIKRDHRGRRMLPAQVRVLASHVSLKVSVRLVRGFVR
jgi:hypothetical protein